jgi:hypothetical protein
MPFLSDAELEETVGYAQHVVAQAEAGTLRDTRPLDLSRAILQLVDTSNDPVVALLR